MSVGKVLLIALGIVLGLIIAVWVVASLVLYDGGKATPPKVAAPAVADTTKAPKAKVDTAAAVVPAAVVSPAVVPSSFWDNVGGFIPYIVAIALLLVGAYLLYRFLHSRGDKKMADEKKDPTEIEGTETEKPAGAETETEKEIDAELEDEKPVVKKTRHTHEGTIHHTHEGAVEKSATSAEVEETVVDLTDRIRVLRHRPVVEVVREDAPRRPVLKDADDDIRRRRGEDGGEECPPTRTTRRAGADGIKVTQRVTRQAGGYNSLIAAGLIALAIVVASWMFTRGQGTAPAPAMAPAPPAAAPAGPSVAELNAYWRNLGK